jgi:hypothetical protein
MELKTIKKMGLAHTLLAGVICLVLGCSNTEKLRSGRTLPGYQLVWADEFNNDGKPDTTSWRYEAGFVRNEEAQWYQEENAFCRNGLLVIEARRELKANPNYDENSRDWKKARKQIEFTSSSLNTRVRAIGSTEGSSCVAASISALVCARLVDPRHQRQVARQWRD